MKKVFTLIIGLALSIQYVLAQSEYYQIKVYNVKQGHQEEVVDEYLEKSFLPSFHQLGVKDIGVFKPIENPNDSSTFIYILIPFKSLDQCFELIQKQAADEKHQKAGSEYLNASPDNPPYIRMESILLKAFKDMPIHKTPEFSTANKDRVYELRSYESATEKLHENKVHMFNEGGEVTLFSELEFNAVFYGSVISGSKMPNLMYMTSFENMESRENHWQKFRDSPVWIAMKAKPEYQTPNVSHIDIYLLYPTDYSDY